MISRNDCRYQQRSYSMDKASARPHETEWAGQGSNLRPWD
jgi:hypothetical protein